MLMQRFREAVCVAVLTALGLAISAPASAGGGFGHVDCDKNPKAPGCEVTVGTPGSPGGSGDTAGGGSGDGSGGDGDDGPCRYERLDPQPPPPTSAGPGGWYVQVCDRDSRVWQSEPVWLDAGQAGDPGALAREAVSRLRLPAPAIRTNPDAARDVLVRVPVWLWIEASTWGARSATASVPGMSVTATATPTQVVWSFGDGSPDQTCTGPGTPWRPGTDPRATSPTCGHTYRSTSAGAPGNSFTLRATVTWSVSWVGGGQSGTVPGLTTTSAVPVRVAQSQAINGGSA